MWFQRTIIGYKAVPHVINNRVLTGEEPCINKAIQRAVNAWLRNFQYDRTGATDLLPLRDVY